MKAISLTQPFATLISVGAKSIETRSWKTSHRGALGIHASKGFPRADRDFALCGPVLTVMKQHFRHDIDYLKQFPLGAIVATCRLIACVPTRFLQANGPIPVDAHAKAADLMMTDQERLFGNYEMGRWAWLLADVRPLARPIPAKGALSLWDWTPPLDGAFDHEPSCRGNDYHECTCGLGSALAIKETK